MVELCNKSCHVVIFTGCTAVTNGTGNSDDFFNISDILFTMVDSVANLGDGGYNGSVGVDIICEGNCLTCLAKCLNRGMSMWNLW